MSSFGEPLPADLAARVAEWLRLDRDPQTRGVIEGLAAIGDAAELTKRLGSRLEFGTAGLRGSMDAGTAHMNALVILQTAQGLAKHLQATCAPELLAAPHGVIIGYDGRIGSGRFARLTAGVLLRRGIYVHLFRTTCPTPFVPMGIRRLGLAAGVMVTASHNPRRDNGFKVYWGNGAQIVPPHDAGIEAAINASLDVAAAEWDESIVEAQSADPMEVVATEFYAGLQGLMRAGPAPAVEGNKPLLTYTAMHGVGTPYVLRGLTSVVGLPREAVQLVAEQCYPDPEFRTVAFPNPEEGKDSLDRAIAAADRAGCDLILANDPDADRLAVAERFSRGGWRIFTGNELGAILGWWAVDCAKARGEVDLAKCALISSAVSSHILGAIAAKEGLAFHQTLTGFKWMGSLAATLEAAGTTTLFAFEEAIGFMCGSRIRDKDGVSAAAVFADLYRRLRAAGKTVAQQLEEIYATYGYHVAQNGYVLSSDPKQTIAMFDAVRGVAADKFAAGALEGLAFPKAIGGSDVRTVRDLVVGYDSTIEGFKATLPTSAVSPMITFQLANGVTVTVRASGTEPKVKYYAEIVGNDAPDALRAKLQETVAAFMHDVVQPKRFGFTVRAS